MKFIFDFDDVLFYNTDGLKKRIYFCLDKIGIPYNESEAYYKKIRGGEFLLKDFIFELLTKKGIKTVKTEDVYEDIMSKAPEFVNKDLTVLIKNLGKENCYLVTYGGYEFNKAKVEKSGLAPLFREIEIVQGSKKESVEKICEKYKDEQVFFTDDKIEFFKDLDFKKCPNLKTILYDEKGLEKLKAILKL